MNSKSAQDVRTLETTVTSSLTHLPKSSFVKDDYVISIPATHAFAKKKSLGFKVVGRMCSSFIHKKPKVKEINYSKEKNALALGSTLQVMKSIGRRRYLKKPKIQVQIMPWEELVELGSDKNTLDVPIGNKVETQDSGKLGGSFNSKQQLIMQKRKKSDLDKKSNRKRHGSSETFSAEQSKTESKGRHNSDRSEKTAENKGHLKYLQVPTRRNRRRLSPKRNSSGFEGRSSEENRRLKFSKHSSTFSAGLFNQPDILMSENSIQSLMNASTSGNDSSFSSSLSNDEEIETQFNSKTQTVEGFSSNLLTQVTKDQSIFLWQLGEKVLNSDSLCKVANTGLNNFMQRFADGHKVSYLVKDITSKQLKDETQLEKNDKTSDLHELQTKGWFNKSPFKGQIVIRSSAKNLLLVEDHKEVEQTRHMEQPTSQIRPEKATTAMTPTDKMIETLRQLHLSESLINILLQQGFTIDEKQRSAKEGSTEDQMRGSKTRTLGHPCHSMDAQVLRHPVPQNITPKCADGDSNEAFIINATQKLPTSKTAIKSLLRGAFNHEYHYMSKALGDPDPYTGMKYSGCHIKGTPSPFQSPNNRYLTAVDQLKSTYNAKFQPPMPKPTSSIDLPGIQRISVN